MPEQIIAELTIAIVISLLIYKFFLKPKDSNRGILNRVEPQKTENISIDKIKQLIGSGHKIEAIKLVRQLTGMGLKDAKDYVEKIERNQFLSLETSSQPEFNFSSEIKQEVLTLLKTGRKLEAIKLVREVSGMGLKEAKDYIESIEHGA